MRVTLFSCGPAANESELTALKHLESRLKSVQSVGEWVLLANVAFSVTHQLQSDEIDIIAIGPPGVRVVEVKHWTAQWVDSHPDLVSQEADRVTNKARKIGTTLRRIVPNLGRVDGSVLLTQEASKIKRIAGREERGIRFSSLNEWKESIGFDAPPCLSYQQIRTLSKAIEPKVAVAMEGSLRRVAGYVNLELQTPKEERFHRIYKGSHSARQDRVEMHLYDLSASEERNAETRARRGYEALHKLQLFPWAPRVLDSFQEAPGYAGEMFFFTLVDPAAPSMDRRASDKSWHQTARVAYARATVGAVEELHRAVGHEPIVHRNLSPSTILVKHDNTPILTGFERTKIPSNVSVASTAVPPSGWGTTAAPEVRTHGLGAADHRSDVYSLCASMKSLFVGHEDDLSQRALSALERGMAENPASRCSLQELQASFSELLSGSVPTAPPPPARFWTEDQVIRFREHDYRIVTRLGSGGVGTTFKVVEIERATREELGTYVAKVGHNAETGGRVLRAYNLARSHLGRHPALSAIFEVAREWQENSFISLMTWIEGAPLREFADVFPLLSDEQQEISQEALALRWLRLMCEALGVLHRNGLIHGDVSPRNMIVSGNELVLTDYDFVAKIGDRLRDGGTVLYCSPSYAENRPASQSDDIYSLAASFFHVVYDKEPFQYGGIQAKERGLNWEGVNRGEFTTLAAFLDRATHKNFEQRFSSVDEALRALQTQELKGGHTELRQLAPAGQSASPVASISAITSLQIRREEKVDWLITLLQSYPGSRWGNRETRGLDTEFASATYVTTELEETLYRDICERRIRLVVLCGNAGDGKTALLQHLASQLGLGKHASSERILEGRLPDGLVVRINLDGSAAWGARSADELLDKFLEPFQQGLPTEDIAHLLAINDGRLLEWIASCETRLNGKETPLTKELSELIESDEGTKTSHIRFIDLNHRSLVGGVTPERNEIQTHFLDRLLDQLYGAENASDIWSPCQSCSAKDRCEVFRAARIFGPNGLPELAPSEVRSSARRRLFEALQAVHLRGETHVTVRELRAALVYILFGVHFCDDYHGEADVPIVPFWDRAFSPDSPHRQGEVLKELARFDPGLEAHPQIDRYLLSKTNPDSNKAAPHYDRLVLESARRRAFFEWTTDNITQIAGNSDALGLARGRHLASFRDLALEKDPEERAALCARLCLGVSHLEDLPPQALDRRGVVPLRITPRTPTETAFWVEKQISAIQLRADIPLLPVMDRLHRQVFLIYRYQDGQEESLRLGADLFHLLLELGEGYQLGDISTDDTFAHLSIFVQRLVREDEHKLFAWNPMQDELTYEVSSRIESTQAGVKQRMFLTRSLRKGDQ